MLSSHTFGTPILPCTAPFSSAGQIDGRLRRVVNVLQIAVGQYANKVATKSNMCVLRDSWNRRSYSVQFMATNKKNIGIIINHQLRVLTCNLGLTHLTLTSPLLLKTPAAHPRSASSRSSLPFTSRWSCRCFVQPEQCWCGRLPYCPLGQLTDSEIKWTNLQQTILIFPNWVS